MTATPATIARETPATPATNPSVERFLALERQLLDAYHVPARPRDLQLREPLIRVRLLEVGSGRPLVVFHGGDGEAVDWAPLMGPLQRHAHIYAVDRPGCGLTDSFDYRTVDLRRHAKDFVESLLDALGLETAVLVGGSMGGFFALVGAIELPSV